MFEFVSNKFKEERAFKVIDNFFEGWFSSKKINYETFLKYYPGSQEWSRENMFIGMLWIYYNYPVDFRPNLPGAKLYRKSNIFRIACFINESDLNPDILKTIVESNIKGDFPCAKKQIKSKDLQYFFGEGGKPEWIVLEHYPSHPFGKKVKGVTRLLPELVKRNKSNIMFTQKAIVNDEKLTPLLGQYISKIENAKMQRKEDRLEEKTIEAFDVIIKKAKIKENEDRKDMYQGFLDQLPKRAINVSQKKKHIPAMASQYRHIVTKKVFVPFVENVDLEINPKSIADKIKNILHEKK